jgi:steroid delta-isomerase-like uncharacterized protein
MSRTDTDQAPSATDAGARAAHVRALFVSLFHDRDFARVRQAWKAESVDHFLAAGLSATGPDELEAFFRRLFSAMPDFDLQIERIVAQGNDVVVQWRAKATFTGTPFLGIEATGAKLDIFGCDVIVLDDQGRVESNTVYYDGAEFARQVGVLPRRDSIAERAIMFGANAVTRIRRPFRAR